MQPISPSSSTESASFPGPPLTTAETVRQQTIARVLQLIRDRNAFTLGFLRRSAHLFWSKRGLPTSSLHKPDGKDVKDMFNTKVFVSGRSRLPASDYPLRPERIRHYHKLACSDCKPFPVDQLHPTCYFNSMIRCITHGWQIPLDPQLIAPVYHTSGNYPSVAHYPDSFSKEHKDMVDQGVLRTCSPSPSTVVNPMGAQIKNSDRMRAKVLVGTDVIDQKTMSAASTELIAMGEPKIKCRITLDPTATGINRATLDLPFRYPSIADFIAIVSKDAVLGLTDIGRYFHSFPLAMESRDYLSVEHNHQLYHYARCAFGYRLCPYYCSAWSAEFRTWFQHLGIPTAHIMVDDWLTVAPTDGLSQAQIDRIERIFQDIGFFISDDKRRFGTRQVALGVLIDTVSMRLSFDKTQARGTRLLLQSQLEHFQSNRRPDQTIIRHLCGKLNWYADVVQSGRLHIRSWWLYLRYGQSLTPAATKAFLHDTNWWISLLTSWEEESTNKLSFRIWSSSELRQPDSIYLVQSDASGEDGCGFHHGYLGQSQQQYYTCRWASRPDHSYIAELEALHKALLHIAPSHPDRVLVWVSDCQSAVSTINNPKCNKEASYALLSSIFAVADQHHLILLAFWIPREENGLADYLSHLACLLNRDEISGAVQDLPADAF